MVRRLNRVASIAVIALVLVTLGCGGGSDGDGDNGSTDTDGDGVADAADAFPNDPTETIDTDKDGTGDNADTDDDADDSDDAFPLDSSESADTDGDGIGDNADPDTQMPMQGNNSDTITTANMEGQDSQCIPESSSNGSAFFDGTFSGSLNADYNIRDNSVGCGGFGNSDGYSISFQVPDPGAEDPQGVVNFMINVDSALAVANNLPATGTLAFSNGDRTGVFDLQECTISITSIGMVPDQFGGELSLPQGVLDCERAVLSSLFESISGPLEDIVFVTPLEFLGGVAVLNL